MTVGSICSREVDLAKLGENVLTVAQRMLQRNVGSVVVVNEDREPIGIVTDRDLTIKVIARGLDPLEVEVGQVLTEYPRMVEEHTPIEQALEIMRDEGFRRMPVVDAEGRLAGMLALDDVLIRHGRQGELIRAIVEQEGPRTLA